MVQKVAKRSLKFYACLQIREVDSFGKLREHCSCGIPRLENDSMRCCNLQLKILVTLSDKKLHDAAAKPLEEAVKMRASLEEILGILRHLVEVQV
jgi:hypothetical protein